MQVKNASFFQLHIEKIILAAGVLFFLIAIGVVVFGVILKPYQVELNNRSYDAPADVIPAMVDSADRLEAGLDKAPEIPEDYVQPDLATDYQQMLERPVLQTSSLVPVSLEGMSEEHRTPNRPPPPTYHVPTPPMVTSVEFKHGFEVLDDTNREVRTAYEELWGGDRRVPADFSYVFIEGEFDMGAWIEDLQDVEEIDNMVPAGIWTTKLGLATVYMVREKLDPSTGQWGDATVVEVLPFYYGVNPGKAMPSDAETAALWVEYWQAYQTDIAMVRPPLLAEGDELLSPRDDPMMQFDAEALEAMDEAVRAEERRRRAEERARAREEARARRAQERENDNAGGGQPGLGGGRGGGRGGGGGASAPGRGGGDPGGASAPGRGGGRTTPDAGRDNPRGTDRSNPRGPGAVPGRDGIDPLDPSGLGRGGGRGNVGGRGSVEEELAENVMRVWALDVTVQPGATYRYKLIAGVINPLYGVERLDEAQLTANEGQAALVPSQEDIDAAEWVGPIEIEPSTRFFVVSASDRGARVNLWRVHNGERIKETQEVDAGDMISGVTVVDIDRRKDINNSTVWVLIYIDEFGILHERSISEDQTASNRFERLLREEAEARARAEEMIGPGNDSGRPGGNDEFGPGGFDPINPGGLGTPGRGR